MSQAMTHEPTGRHQSRIAAASGWIGSALEYYDFFIYATAASLIFPQMFFPSSQSDRRHRRVARDLRRRLRRPADRRVRARPLGRHARPQERAARLPVPDGRSRRWRSGCCRPMRRWGSGRRSCWSILRLIQGFAVAGEISGASSMILEHAPFGRRGYFASFTLQGVQAGQILAAAVFLPLSYALSKEAFVAWGWRVPFLLSVFVLIAGYIIRREVEETPAFAEEKAHRVVPKAPVIDALTNHWADMLRVVCMALMNVIPVVATIFGAAYAVQPGYGVGMDRSVYLWIPGHRQHRRGGRNPLRRRPFRPHRPPSADHRRLAVVGSAVVRLPLCDQHQERAARIRLFDPDVGGRLPGLQRGLSELLPGTLSDPGARLRRWRSRRMSAPC